MQTWWLQHADMVVVHANNIQGCLYGTQGRGVMVLSGSVSPYGVQVAYKYGVETHNLLKELGADITFKTYNGMAHSVRHAVLCMCKACSFGGWGALFCNPAGCLQLVLRTSNRGIGAVLKSSLADEAIVQV